MFGQSEGRGKIAQDSIKQVLDRVRLSEVVARSVELKRSGARLLGLCPFHQEKTPSFFVFDDHYKCFGCQAHGNVIDFEMNRTGAPFRETVQQLAGQFGIELQYEQGQSESDEWREKRLESARQKAILEHVADFYSRCLVHPKHGREARNYLSEKRGLSEDTIRQFRLGYALDQNCMEKLGQKHQWKHEKLRQLSLVRESRGGGRFYDFFRDRLMVPIRDERGDVVAFGGRVLREEPNRPGGRPPPKYLNSPESQVFQKSGILFNLHQARSHILKDKEVILVEGYMDVLALHQAGFPNAVAVLGTALTPDHVRLLARYAERVFLCFDADQAGQQAMLRSFHTAWPLNLLQFYTFSLNGAKDPDELIQKEGAEAFSREMRKAVPLLHAAVLAVCVGVPYREERARLVHKHILPTVEKNAGQLEKTAALEDLAQMLGLGDVRSLRATLQRPKSHTQDQGKGSDGLARAASLENSPGHSSSASSSQAYRLFSGLELKFLLHVLLCEWHELPLRVRSYYLGSEQIPMLNPADVGIAVKALESQFSPIGLEAFDEHIWGLVEGLSHLAGDAETVGLSRLSDGGQRSLAPLNRVLRSFADEDLEQLENFGIDLNLLNARVVGGGAYRADRPLFHLDNLGFLRFSLRDALASRKKGSLPGQVEKLLVDFEVAYLDKELARWTAAKDASQLENSRNDGDIREKSRRILQERARRLLCLQQENFVGLNQPLS